MVVDGADLYGKAIEKIHELRARLEVVESAFRAYVSDDLEESRRGDERRNPPILGLCAKCGFPVYESDCHSGRMFHYSRMRFMSKPLTCNQPKLTE
jgi:hypothetical protein